MFWLVSRCFVAEISDSRCPRAFSSQSFSDTCCGRLSSRASCPRSGRKKTKRPLGLRAHLATDTSLRTTAPTRQFASAKAAEVVCPFQNKLVSEAAVPETLCTSHIKPSDNSERGLGGEIKWLLLLSSSVGANIVDTDMDMDMEVFCGRSSWSSRTRSLMLYGGSVMMASKNLYRTYPNKRREIINAKRS